MRELSNNRGDMSGVARRALEPSHQKVVDELWMEMLVALKALGFA